MEFIYEMGPDQSPSEGVVEAMCAVSNIEPTSLDPLYSVIDPDALDTIFESGFSGNPTVKFQYNGREVMVENGREITIRQIDE
jgi:hypothetical protein